MIALPPLFPEAYLTRNGNLTRAALPWRLEEARDADGDPVGMVEIRDANGVIVADVYWAQRAALIVEAVNRMGSGQPAADARGDVEVFDLGRRKLA